MSLFPKKVAYLAERKILHAFYSWTQVEIHNILEDKEDVVNFHGGYSGKKRATKVKRLTQKQLDKIISKTGKILPGIPPVGKFVVIEKKDKIGYSD